MSNEEVEGAATRTPRRVQASAKRLEDIIATGQRRGLSPSAIVLHADGSTEVKYADAPPVRAHKPRGWEV